MEKRILAASQARCAMRDRQLEKHPKRTDAEAKIQSAPNQTTNEGRRKSNRRRLSRTTGWKVSLI